MAQSKKSEVVYVGPFDAVDVELPDGRFWGPCVRGEPVTVPEPVADLLLAQPDNWQPAKPSKPKNDAGAAGGKD